MDEKEFIYGRLKYLTDEVHRLDESIEKLMEYQEKILDNVSKLLTIIERIASTEFIKQQNAKIQAEDMANKIKYINDMLQNKFK